MDHCLPANVSSSRPVRESILEIDDHSWIVGDRLIISLQPAVPSGPFWSDGADAFYTISELASQQPQPQTRSLSPTSRIKLVHDAGDANAAWRIGEAFLKVQKQSHQQRTREHTTLDFLHDPANGIELTSSIPRVLYHNEFNERYYLMTTRVAGETLEKAWPAMGEAAKQACVTQVVDTCKALARKENDKICGIDGDLSNECKVGIIDWEMTGFVPKAWIRTKFCVCGAMDFDFTAIDVKRSKEWRQRVQLQLAQEGFSEVAEAWERLFWENYQAIYTK
ncbi:uncharacterized protein TRUGW13939_10845 [Talaromyces rugulosus]|uniref:Aminoglycoside phosphotransferase domain-containing protein n=1 Tax=Talaromyces rugulosus TaxID=121627 RepID=A0A7H8RB62_TALRU|nr:uncharacterized protein TRUGW13939_10845 [Talaromyces rugulosus]QKX63674.1 hypothetical protein TRUGW13939_10845 [Talaromyces rugulosus]